MFHLTSVDAEGAVVERKRLRRARRMAMRNRVAQCNRIHGFLLECRIEAPKGAALAAAVGEGVSEILCVSSFSKITLTLAPQ